MSEENQEYGNNKKKTLDEISPEQMQKDLEALTEKVHKKHHTAGIPYTIGRDGKVINVYPDGSEKVIGIMHSNSTESLSDVTPEQMNEDLKNLLDEVHKKHHAAGQPYTGIDDDGKIVRVYPDGRKEKII